MNPVYLKHRSKNWAIPPGGERFSVEYYGPFPFRRNAVLARNILRRIDANTGLYWDETSTTTQVPKSARVLTWNEWIDCMGRFWPGREKALRLTSPEESAILKP